MKLSDQELSFYNTQGFLFLPGHFTFQECGLLRAQLRTLFSQNLPNRIMEKDGVTVRSVYGVHTENEVMGLVIRHPRILEPAMQIIANEVYVHQFKINKKAAFKGDVWEWHQDYIFWLKEDGIPGAHLTNVVIFLDEVNEFNGPLLLLPGSQKENVIEIPARQSFSPDAAANSAWISDLTADLKYSLDQSTLADLVEKYPIVAPKGPSGSVLFFHPNIVHGSSPNMSPFDRSIMIISYNSVGNMPIPIEERRPDFLCSRDYRALDLLNNDTLSPINIA